MFITNDFPKFSADLVSALSSLQYAMAWEGLELIDAPHVNRLSART